MAAKVVGLHPWTDAVTGHARNLGISSETVQKIKTWVDPIFRALASLAQGIYSLTRWVVSYCNPTTSSSSTPVVSAADLSAILSRADVDLEWVELERAALRLDSLTDEQHKEKFGVSKLEARTLANTQFYRYTNVPCLESTRVSLGGNLLIHANWVCGGAYIATQGPTQQSAPNFWNMVLKQHDDIQIVMLTQYIEGNTEKCYRYLPTPAQPLHMDSTVIQHITEMPEEMQGVKVRDFKATVSPKEKSIRHYMYWGWPDHGCVSPQELARFVKKIYEDRKPDSSLIVHCSAGIGRTGTFLAIFELYARFKRGALSESELPGLVPNMVRKLREERYGMVQQQVQYQLIYDTLKVLIRE